MGVLSRTIFSLVASCFVLPAGQAYTSFSGGSYLVQENCRPKCARAAKAAGASSSAVAAVADFLPRFQEVCEASCDFSCSGGSAPSACAIVRGSSAAPLTQLSRAVQGLCVEEACGAGGTAHAAVGQLVRQRAGGVATDAIVAAVSRGASAACGEGCRRFLMVGNATHPGSIDAGRRSSDAGNTAAVDNTQACTQLCNQEAESRFGDKASEAAARRASSGLDGQQVSTKGTVAARGARGDGGGRGC